MMSNAPTGITGVQPASNISQAPMNAAQMVGEKVMDMSSTTMDIGRGFKDRLMMGLSRGLDMMRYYMREYPLIRAFLYVMAVFSAIPISIFAAYAVTTFIGSVIVATIGVGIVEGGLLTMGGLVLLPFLGGGLLLTLMSVSTYYGILYSIRGVYYALDYLRSMTSSTSTAASVLDTGKSAAATAESYAAPPVS